MDFIFSILFGSRLLAGLTGGLGNVTPAHFDPPQIILTATDVRMSCVLRDVCPPQLSKLARTSTPITLYFFVDLYRGRGRDRVAQVVVERQLVYDIIDREFRVACTPPGDTVRATEMDSLMPQFGSFSAVPVCVLDSIIPQEEYYFVTYAVLGKATVEALDNRSIDLMYYWDYKRPTLRTQSYGGAQLLVKKR